ncbi:MAG: FdhF/YdeP family oxidoreductase [Tenacibaculum sp.]
MKNKKIKKQTPNDFTGIKISKIPKKAVGAKAVQSALKHIISQTGLSKGFHLLKNLNQNRGFDCPGCAWPDPDDKRALLAEYCENGAKAVAEEATKNRVSPLFFAAHSVTELLQWSDYKLGKSGRITHPMVLFKGSKHYKEISWDNAFSLIGKHLNKLSSPNRAIFYTSGRTSNEAAFLYQLFVRQFGTNNLPDCSNLCHESSGSALTQTLGIGKGSVTLDDFKHTNLIIVMGQNPGTNHPRMLTALSQAKQHGGKIIAINPLPEAGLMNYIDPQNPFKWFGNGQKLTDLFLQIKINGDVALLKIIMKLMKEKEQKQANSVFDYEFISQKTRGFEEFTASLDNYTIDNLLPQTGLTLSEIKNAVELIIASKRIIICWAMGLTQHKNGVDNIREIVNLLLLKGSIGKKGAGTCPVRGHSNVQGDRTMGIWEKPKESFLKALEKEFQFTAPKKHGYDVVEAIKAMYAKKAKVFIAMGGNFLSATPDTEFTTKALHNCELSVQISTKLNRSHLVHGKNALILPCLARSEKDIQKSGEQFITVENSMGVVHKSQGYLKPASSMLLSEPAIVAGMAQATLKNTKLNWSKLINNYNLIRNKIEATIKGFENYNQRVLKKGGFYLPNSARNGDFSASPTGKANFSINRISDIVLNNNEFILMTIRSHDQYNTTIYGLNDRYRGILNERRVVLINPSDMKKLGLKKLDKVNLTSYFEQQQRVANNFLAIPYPIPKQCTAAYFPEVNVLVPIKSKAKISNTPAYKGIIISINKA